MRVSVEYLSIKLEGKIVSVEPFKFTFEVKLVNVGGGYGSSLKLKGSMTVLGWSALS
jgi:hypothetical protein